TEAAPPAGPELRPAGRRIAQAEPEVRTGGAAPVSASRAAAAPAPMGGPQQVALGVQAAGAGAPGSSSGGAGGGGGVAAAPHRVRPNMLSVESAGGPRVGDGATLAGAVRGGPGAGTGPGREG